MLLFIFGALYVIISKGDKMRLRNVKDASNKIEKSEFLIKDYKENKGNFNQLFNNKNELHVEIGAGKGDFIINSAIKNPEINYIGIEKFDSVLVRAIEKIEEKQIDNLFFIRMDATDIEDIFDKEIDALYLNFSDPWPKKRHAHRRLTSTNFLKKYDNIFKNTKKIHIKTDNRKLFEFSLVELVNYGYLIENISLDLYKDDLEDNVSTEYEKKFANMGNNIYQLSVKKN